MNFEKYERHLEWLRERDRTLIRDAIGEPAKDGQLFAYSTFILLLELQDYLGELSARALNDPIAAENLWTFAGVACRDLWEVCERKPDMVRIFAAKKMVFPVGWPLVKGHQKRIFEKIESLGIGTGAIYRLPIKKKQFDPDTPVNRLVLFHVRLINWLQCEYQMEFARQLTAELGGKSVSPVEIFVQDSITRIKNPWLKQVMSLVRLSRSNADEWAETIWQNILNTHDGKPETNPELRGIGEYRKRHSEYQEQQKTATPRTAAANIRAGIKERIFKAVHILAG